MKPQGDRRRDEGIQARLPQGPAPRQGSLERVEATQRAEDARSNRLRRPAEWTSSIVKHPAGAGLLPGCVVVRLARVPCLAAATG
jgi:hypothetical protein